MVSAKPLPLYIAAVRFVVELAPEWHVFHFQATHSELSIEPVKRAKPTHLEHGRSHKAKFVSCFFT